MEGVQVRKREVCTPGVSWHCMAYSAVSRFNARETETQWDACARPWMCVCMCSVLSCTEILQELAAEKPEASRGPAMSSF